MSNHQFKNALNRVNQSIPPIWFMRQAGRYHSHYQNLKKKYSFEQLCKTPELAAEVACGPIQEFDYDIAILFSDILFLLEGLGLELTFDPKPRFGSLINSKNFKDFSNIDKAIEHMQFQSEAIKLTREKLADNKSLIGFVGGPWTLLCYAFGKDQVNSIDANNQLEFLSNTVVPLLKKNIKLQLDAGAEIVMVLDSQLKDLNSKDFKDIYINFLNDIASTYPMKIGYYSKGKNETDLYNCFKIPFAGFGYDHSINLSNIFNNQNTGFVQGNFNEELMLLDTDIFLKKLKDYINHMKSIENRNGWICGLGHGINKDTPEKNVHLFIENIRKEFC